MGYDLLKAMRKTLVPAVPEENERVESGLLVLGFEF